MSMPPSRTSESEDCPVPLLLDITHETCPMTFVRTRLALDRLLPGDLLLVRLVGDEPRHSVPAHAAMLGHEVIRRRDGEDGVTEILLRKGPGSRPSAS